MKKNFSTQVLRYRDAPDRASRGMGAAVGGLLKRMASRRTAAVALVACAIALGGCGLVKVGYRNGDIVGLYLIDRYFDLSSEQEDFVKPRLHQLLVWHRTTQLPEYASFGVDLRRRALLPITPAEITALNEEGKRRAMITIDHALPDMADLALRLTPDNLKALQKKFADDTDKWRRENMKGDVDRQKKARFDKTLDRVEEWYGRLDGDQRARIRQWSDERPFNNDFVAADRLRRQQDLVALLTRVERDKPSREVVVAQMKAYADHFEDDPDPERAAFMASLRKATEDMDAQIHNLTTPQQRAKASAHLQEWIDDFRSLSASAG